MAKRNSGVGAGSAHKKSRTTEVDVAIDIVIEAVQKADCFPQHVRDMLVAGAKSALSEMASERHPYQQQTVEFIEEVLTASEQNLRTQVEAAQSRIHELQREQNQKAKVVDELQAKVADLSGVHAEASQRSMDARDACAVVQGNLEQARKEKAKGDASLAETQNKRGSVEVFASGTLAEAKTNSCSKKSIDTCLKQFKKLFGVPDPVLVDCLAPVLTKAPEARVGFDLTVLQHIDELVARKIAEYDDVIKSAEPAKDERAASVSAAESEAASKAVTAEGESAKEGEAKAALVAEERQLKDAGKVKKDADEELKNAQSAHEHACKELESFTEGVLAKFASQKVRDGALPQNAEVPAASQVHN